jgi:ribonuclease VapC
VIEEEEGHVDLFRALLAASTIAAGVPTLFETAIVLIARKGAAGHARLLRFLDENAIASIPFDGRHWEVAAEAYIRFGKGRHPARLNYGDCMTYATAKVAAAPLLCIGEDFVRTDLPLALA